MGVTRVDRLSEEEEARLAEWDHRWVEVGLRTGPADRERFEAAVRACYEFSGIEWHGTVVWVPSPLVLSLAAPAAAHLIEDRGRRVPFAQNRSRNALVAGAAGTGSLTETVRSAADQAASEAMTKAMRVPIEVSAAAVEGASRGTEGGSVRGSMVGPMAGVVHHAIGRAVDNEVWSTVHFGLEERLAEDVGGANGHAARGQVYTSAFLPVRDALEAAEHEISRQFPRSIRHAWEYHLGGQLWPGGFYSPACTSFFREVCELELTGDLWNRARAYEQTAESACWWWPHSRFVMVSERPVELHTEMTGWTEKLALHREDGPAVAWSDGERTYRWHGLPVPADVIEKPETITAQRILSEPNVEVRRAMLEKVGYGPLMARAQPVHKDDYGELLRINQADDEPILLVKVVNSTPEPDGHFRDYVIRVDPSCRTAREAVAWSFDIHPDDYTVATET